MKNNILTSELIEEAEESWECCMLFYDKNLNIIMDADGLPVYDIFRIISPSDLSIFKASKKDFMKIGPKGQIIELFYPDEDCENNYYGGM